MVFLKNLCIELSFASLDVKFSVFFNGSLVGYFKGGKGLRQLTA